MGYEWLDWALHGLAGIEPQEVMEVLNDSSRPKLGIPGEWEGTDVLVVLGRTAARRPLLIMVKQRARWQFQILSARDMTDDEVRQYEGWEATR